MKITLTTHDAVRRLMADTDANWSYNGAMALVEHIEEGEEDGKEIEFDRCEIRCDWSEYESLVEFAKDRISDYKSELSIDDDMSDDDIDNVIREYVQYHGELIEFDGGIIVSSF